MNTLEKIVPLLDLCKLIPAGEFEDSVLVWLYDDINGFLCRSSGCEQIRKKEWQIINNYPSKIARRRKLGYEIYPAPTLEEIRRELRNLSVTNLGKEINVACKIDPETWIREKSKNGDVTSAALRVWLKMKGFEVKK